MKKYLLIIMALLLLLGCSKTKTANSDALNSAGHTSDIVADGQPKIDNSSGDIGDANPTKVNKDTTKAPIPEENEQLIKNLYIEIAPLYFEDMFNYQKANGILKYLSDPTESDYYDCQMSREYYDNANHNQCEFDPYFIEIPYEYNASNKKYYKDSYGIRDIYAYNITWIDKTTVEVLGNFPVVYKYHSNEDDPGYFTVFELILYFEYEDEKWFLADGGNSRDRNLDDYYANYYQRSRCQYNSKK